MHLAQKLIEKFIQLMYNRIVSVMRINRWTYAKVILLIFWNKIQIHRLDPKLGPGKYEYEETTKLINNLGPTIVNTNGIMLNRTDKRFKDPVTVGPPPNYLPTDKLTSLSALPKPFNAQSSRFERNKSGLFLIDSSILVKLTQMNPSDPDTTLWAINQSDVAFEINQPSQLRLSFYQAVIMNASHCGLLSMSKKSWNDMADAYNTCNCTIKLKTKRNIWPVNFILRNRRIKKQNEGIRLKSI